MPSDQKQPTFLFIGPDKTGSSWLHRILRAHPDCHVPAAKDLYFFDRYYSKGYDWYLSQFGQASPQAQAIGELSHDYLFSPEAAQRIAQHLPQIQLLTILRDPVERAFSHYLYARAIGWTQRSFEQELEATPEIIGNSLYGRHLSTYAALFPRAQLGILSFDSLQQDPVHFAREVYSLLGLRWVDGDHYHEKTRPAAAPRNAQLNYVVRRIGQVVRGAGFPGVVGALKNSRLASRLYRPYGEADKPRIADATRQQLIERFRPDVQVLVQLLQPNEARQMRWLGSYVSAAAPAVHGRPGRHG